MGKHEAEVAEMVLLLILTVALFASCVCFVWPRTEPESTTFETEQDDRRDPSPTGEPGSREGVLVNLLRPSSTSGIAFLAGPREQDVGDRPSRRGGAGGAVADPQCQLRVACATE